MTLYTIVPLETVFQEWGPTEPARTMEITLNGTSMEVEMLNYRQAKIVRLFSTDPNDFMKPEWTPGNVVDLTGTRN